MNAHMIQLRPTEALTEKDGTLYWLAQQTEIAYSTLFKFAKAKTRSVDSRVLDEISDALDSLPGDLLTRMFNGHNSKKASKKGKTTK